MFSDEFFGFFPEAPGAFPMEDLKIFQGFFDALELWEASWDDPGWILETSFFPKILKKMGPKFRPMSQLFSMLIP